MPTFTCPSCKKSREFAHGSAFTMHAKWCGVTPAERFWPRVDKSAGPDKCWIWKGATCPPSGYGRFHLKRPMIAAHRAAWILTNGPIPDGLDIMHTCDNPPCVNPAHLRAATTSENLRDMWAKGRHPHARRGLKLTREQASEIKARFKRTGPKASNSKELAAEYGIAWQTVLNIVNGRMWKSA